MTVTGTASPSTSTGRITRHPSQTELDELCINTIRCLSMDAVQKARSGHPGMPMGMASVGYRLWTKQMRHNPRNPRWLNRDRFVLSNGHGCMLLYSLLHLTGYDLPLEEIQNFRQWGSRTPGHPEYGHTPGVEATTGPLGQGLSNAVGMAIAEQYLAARFNTPGHRIIDYKVYVFAGDGCLQEGVASEACSLAGHLGLNNLIVVYDDNRITIDGSTDLSFTEDVAARFESYGWAVRSVDGDGNDLRAIDEALSAAAAETNRPTLIRLRTHIGYGSPHKQDSHDAHGSPLGEEEVALTKQALGWDPAKVFHVPEEVLKSMRSVADQGAAAEARWKELLESYRKEEPERAAEFSRVASGTLPEAWETFWKENKSLFESGAGVATRQAQGAFLDALMPHLPLVLGGSADLTPSNNTRFKGAEDFSRTNRSGRYIRYGVREHGMAAIMNGIALSGLLIPYGATFFTFSDYMRPSIRLAALSGYPSIFLFTHDSIGLGEDGPTHQAVEHLAALRAIPGLVVLRPADAGETMYAWKYAIENRKGPTAIALTRQAIPVLDRRAFPGAENLLKGGYVLSEGKDPRLILIASGSEVHLALAAAEELVSEGLEARVVSMPSWELFENQPEEYRSNVLPPGVRKRIGIEAGVVQGWERYLGPEGVFIGMSSFGASAPGGELFKRFGITVETIVTTARRICS
ncbi:MAG: transketolase [Ignavibacteria bacterium]|nr:transketolase [Ignavibacteria bacterium]